MNASYKTAIQFKDLYIPVKMLKISHNSSIELNQLCKDSKERVRYIKFCPSCNKEIHNEDIVKDINMQKISMLFWNNMI